ncbi:hypothetical protein ANRL3_02359 [Anaerolineae bacterium]|nr:hypothetical protein ANRL3_02359 [Anaerolineae bacterium]
MRPLVKKCIIDTHVYQDALTFAANTERDEWGGIGIGSYTKEGNVLVKGMVFPPQYRNNSAYCAFEMKHLALLKFALEDLGLLAQITMVAWAHTHPGHGIFLSDIDKKTFGDLINENNRLVAVVIEPVMKEIGAFSGVNADERIAVECREIALKDDHKIRLALLESMLPEMDKILVPPMPADFSANSALEVAFSLADKVVRLRKWLANHELARIANQAESAESTQGE